MTILLKDWRITSAKRYYQLQRRLGSGRWITEGYYPDLRQACQGLFDHRLQTETTHFIIDGDCANCAGSSTLQQLLTHIEALWSELAAAIERHELLTKQLIYTLEKKDDKSNAREILDGRKVSE